MGKTTQIAVLLAVAACALIAIVWLPTMREATQGGRTDQPSPLALPPIKRPDSASSADGSAVSTLSAEVLGLLPEGEIEWVRTLRQIPTTKSELEGAYERNRSQTCEPVPSGEPLVITDFRPYLTRRDVREYGEVVPATSIRQHIFSLGLDMFSSDEGMLPKLSRHEILRFLDDNYVSIQVRVQKDLATGALFLHHRPLAAVAAYRRARVTQEPPAAVTGALKDYRSLGLFLPENAKPVPANLQTLVLLYKRDLPNRIRADDVAYEFVFIHARRYQVDGEQALQLHAFVTYDDRRELYYLQPEERPSRPSDCSLTTMLYFTEYVDAGLRPVAGGSRASMFRSRTRYSMDAIAEFTSAAGWDAFAELPQTLDAIIDGKIAVDAGPP